MAGKHVLRIAALFGFLALVSPAGAAAPSWQHLAATGDAAFNSGNYAGAIDAYDQGIKAAEADRQTPETRAALGRMLTNKGNALLKLKRNSEAIAAYSQAAATDPHPATAYFNLCATEYNTGNVEGALAACDKAIKFDPKKADAYFIRGSLLLGDSKAGKDGKVVAPRGTEEALRKYLELAPNGPHAKDVREMLAFIGAPAGK